MQQDGQTLHKKGTNYMVKKSINRNQIKNYKYYKQEIRQKNKKNIKIIGTNYAVIQYYINELIKKSKKSIKIYKTSIDFYC